MGSGAGLVFVAAAVVAVAVAMAVVWLVAGAVHNVSILGGGWRAGGWAMRGGRALPALAPPPGGPRGPVTPPASLGVLDWLGAAVWAVGFLLEALGDAQLDRFKADPANRDKVMDRGLWRYTR